MSACLLIIASCLLFHASFFLYLVPPRFLYSENVSVLIDLPRIDRYTRVNAPSHELSASNLPQSKPPTSASNLRVDQLQAPYSPSGSMMTNPSANNPMHPPQHDFHLPPQHNMHSGHPHSMAAGYGRNSSNGFLVASPPRKAGRSTSMGMPTSNLTYFDNNNSAAVSSAGNSITGGPSAHGYASQGLGITPAPTSIPPDLHAMQQPPQPISGLDSSEPKLFPGIFSKSRQGSVTTQNPLARLNNAESSSRRGSVERVDEGDKAMTDSLAGLGRVRSEGGTSAAITEESEVGDEDDGASDGEGN